MQKGLQKNWQPSLTQFSKPLMKKRISRRTRMIISESTMNRWTDKKKNRKRTKRIHDRFGNRYIVQSLKNMYLYQILGAKICSKMW